MRKRCLDPTHGTQDVRVVGELPSPHAGGGRRRRDVVDENVEPAEPTRRGIDPACVVVRLRHVHRIPQRRDALCFQALHGRLHVRRRACADGDIHTLFAQHVCGLEANAFACAGDDRFATFQVEIHECARAAGMNAAHYSPIDAGCQTRHGLRSLRGVSQEMRRNVSRGQLRQAPHVVHSEHRAQRFRQHSSIQIELFLPLDWVLSRCRWSCRTSALPLGCDRRLC